MKQKKKARNGKEPDMEGNKEQRDGFDPAQPLIRASRTTNLTVLSPTSCNIYAVRLHLCRENLPAEKFTRRKSSATRFNRGFTVWSVRGFSDW
jgi:hypothetical protein